MPCHQDDICAPLLGSHVRLPVHVLIAKGLGAHCKRPGFLESSFLLKHELTQMLLSSLVMGLCCGHVTQGLNRLRRTLISEIFKEQEAPSKALGNQCPATETCFDRTEEKTSYAGSRVTMLLCDDCSARFYSKIERRGCMRAKAPRNPPPREETKEIGQWGLM
eukprot:72225-Pelagomonas_calceolata.AAC.1